MERDSLYFEKFIGLLLKLHALIEKGDGDYYEADSIRDDMDIYWKHLSETEVNLCRELSAALYFVRDPNLDFKRVK